MAVLAVAGIGAVAGLGIGAAAGLTTFAALATAASIGFSVGTLVGQQLFPEQVKQEGSRLNDLTVSGSAFGAVRPIVYGQVRLAGNVIWATPIQEVKTTQKHGKGGSGPSVTSTTYTYYGTFALALCEGPIAAVLRIWADSKLIYDATGSQLIQAPGVKFRFYPGDETNSPTASSKPTRARRTCRRIAALATSCSICCRWRTMATVCRTSHVRSRPSTRRPIRISAWTPADPSIVGPTLPIEDAMAVDWDREPRLLPGSDPFGLDCGGCDDVPDHPRSADDGGIV